MLNQMVPPHHPEMQQFTAQANQHMMSTDEWTNHVLNNPHRFDPATVKRAILYRTFKKASQGKGGQ